jgi:hypothetical protein
MREAVARVLAGDTEAFREIVRECGPMVRVYLAAHVRDHQQVEDLSQEVFVAAYWSLASFDASRDFRGSGWRLPPVRPSAGGRVNARRRRRGAAVPASEPRGSVRCRKCRRRAAPPAR